jgi:hypothetical protein
MNKIFFLSIITCGLLISSCTKQLNQTPISQGTTATFYHSPSDFIQGANAVYNDLRGATGAPGYPDRLLNLSEIRSDNIYGVSVAVRDWDPINDFSPGIAPNTYVEEGWSTDFNGIFRANVLLDQIKKNGSFINSASLATRLQAEAQYLRAFYYFDLVRYYGKLPIIDHPVLAPEAITIGRSSLDSVYKFIISDLQFAIANLPPSYTGVDIGRASKYAAEATLALVYMTRSGPTYGIEGAGMGTNEWGLALPLLNDIVNSGLFVFNPNFANIFSYSNQNPALNKEAIFDVMYISGQSPTLGATFLWDLTPGQYFVSIGDSKTLSGSLEIIPVSNDLLNDFPAGDKRKTQTIHTTGFTTAGSTELRPFYRKYLDTTKIPASGSRFDWGINFIVTRYTDVLMNEAECILNGAPGSQTTVDSIVNLVRVRAGLPTITGVTKAQFFDERRREFADEGSRWFDLQRSGNLLTTMNAWIAAEDVGHRINPVIANYIIYPVPQSQLDAAPGLYTQNPGY